MVKIIASILISFALLCGVSIYNLAFVNNTFTRFSEELTALYRKTEEKRATREDAEAIRISWNKKKESLHVWIPHNDISYIDYWLSEGLSYIYTEDYDDALSKIEVLLEITENIPSAYSLSLENVF